MLKMKGSKDQQVDGFLNRKFREKEGFQRRTVNRSRAIVQEHGFLNRNSSENEGFER